mmetsp:Transcript_65647/g.180058  ORF Transcript_65647/g.180058 Transcript_65647/m.180058 type:complete len:226 (+) Transcript_65647:231-908(+)
MTPRARRRSAPACRSTGGRSASGLRGASPKTWLRSITAGGRDARTASTSTTAMCAGTKTARRACAPGPSAGRGRARRRRREPAWRWSQRLPMRRRCTEQPRGRRWSRRQRGWTQSMRRRRWSRLARRHLGRVALCASSDDDHVSRDGRTCDQDARALHNNRTRRRGLRRERTGKTVGAPGWLDVSRVQLCTGACECPRCEVRGAEDGLEDGSAVVCVWWEFACVT